MRRPAQAVRTRNVCSNRKFSIALPEPCGALFVHNNFDLSTRVSVCNVNSWSQNIVYQPHVSNWSPPHWWRTNMSHPPASNCWLWCDDDQWCRIGNWTWASFVSARLAHISTRYDYKCKLTKLFRNQITIIICMLVQVNTLQQQRVHVLYTVRVPCSLYTCYQHMGRVRAARFAFASCGWLAVLPAPANDASEIWPIVCLNSGKGYHFTDRY